MNNFFKIKYRTELSSDSKYVNVYSPNGKLMSCFYMKLEQGKAVLCDKVNNSLSVIPAQDEVILIEPFEYDKESDTLSVIIILKGMESVLFKSTIHDLMGVKNFMSSTTCVPPITRPSDEPIMDRFATIEELMNERKMRKRGDAEILDILGTTDSKTDTFADKIKTLEGAISRNEKVDCEQNKKIELISDTTEKLKYETIKSLSEFKKTINDESEKRVSGQNKLYDGYVGIQKQADKNTEKIIELNDLVTKDRNRALNAERELHCEIEREGKKYHSSIKNLYEVLKLEKEERKEDDEALNKKINAEHRYILQVKNECEEGLIQERKDRSAKDEEIINSFDSKYQPKGEYIQYVSADDKQVLKLPFETYIVGENSDGSVVNLLEKNDDNISVGSKTMPIRILGKEERPIYNEDKEIALLYDVENAFEVVNLQVSDNKEDIEGKFTALEHEFYHYQEQANKQFIAFTDLIRNLQEQIDCLTSKLEEHE